MDELFKILGVSGIVLTAFVWLAKSIITKLIESGSDIFKNKLDKELAIHTKNLDVMKIQYQIQYSSLHEKRGKVIIKLYSLLYDLEQDLVNYTSLNQGADWVNDPKRDEKATETLINTKALFEKNRFFFNENLCDNINKILKEREDVIKKMRKAKITAKHLGDGAKLKLESEEMPMNIWMEQEEKVRKEIDESRKQLANEFRTLFGVEIIK